MKGIVFDGEELRLVEGLEVRSPGAGEVTVKIVNAGVCHSDVSVIDGTIPFPTPLVLGHAVSYTHLTLPTILLV